MNYLKLPLMSTPVSIFDICQAHAQLESDYNQGGWLQERPSNQRRNEASSCQLQRLKFHAPYRWVEICANDDDLDNDDVRDIYLLNVLNLDLPIDDQMRDFIASRYTAEFLSTFPAWRAS